VQLVEPGQLEGGKGKTDRKEAVQKTALHHQEHEFSPVMFGGRCEGTDGEHVRGGSTLGAMSSFS
jgi:hypothetical protein